MKGTFFMTDQEFKFFKNISSKNDKMVKEYFNLFKLLFEGLIEGALCAINIESSVESNIINEIEADITFTIKINNYEEPKQSNENLI